MNILFATDQYTPAVNGVVTQVLAIRAELKKRGHRVVVLTEQYNGEPSGEDIWRLPTVVFPLRSADRLAWPYNKKIEQVLSEIPFDVLHTHFLTTGFLGMRLAKKNHFPRVATLHTLFSQYLHYVLPFGADMVKPIAYSFARKYLADYDTVLAPSQKAVTELENIKAKPQIKLFPNGFDFSLFDKASGEAFRSQFHIDSKAPLATVVGRVDKGKNVDLVVEAFALINKELPESRLAVVGSGLELEKVKARVKDLGLTEKVVITGFLSQELTASAYAASNVLLFASTVDTQPSVVIEAEYLGNPVVTISDPAISNLVKDGENGFVVEKTAEALSDGALRIFKNVSLADQMGKSSQNLAQNFSIARYVDGLEVIYSDLSKKYKSNERAGIV